MPSSLIRVASIAAALLLAETTGEGQGVPRAQMVNPSGIPATSGGGLYVPAQPQERMTVVDPDKKLSAGDQVTVEIVEDREGGLPRVVTATGELDVPPLGRVRVTGKTAVQAASDIKHLLEKDYYYTATVRIAIDRVSPIQVQMGAVQVSGYVRMGGAVQILAGEPLTLTAAILKCGGVGEWGDSKKVKLTRLINGVSDTIEVNYKKISETGDIQNDPVLKDGDRIYVPKLWGRL